MSSSYISVIVIIGYKQHTSIYFVLTVYQGNSLSVLHSCYFIYSSEHSWDKNTIIFFQNRRVRNQIKQFVQGHIILKWKSTFIPNPLTLHSLIFFLSYLFIYGCAGSLLLCGLFSGCSELGLHSSHSAWASRCRGFSCC